jgi:hypothetical protein
MAASAPDPHERARNGTLAVVGGRVVVESASPGGRDPELDWEDGIVVLIDGVPPASRPCPVLYGQSIEALVPDEEPRVELFVELSRDEMSATLSVERHPGGRFRLEDQLPDRALVIRRLIVERIPCPAPTAELVDTFLYARGVVHGVHDDAVRRCLDGVALGEQVAWGTRPVDPVDGEVTFATQLTHGRAGVLWSAPAGTVLATCRLPVPGVPGCTVCGESVPVREPRSGDIELGDNVATAAHGVRLVSAIDGFPALHDGRLEVSPVARVERDLDDWTGDIHGYGSLELVGNVREGRVLRVRRDLQITGSVEGAQIEVGGSAEITGIVTASSLAVGGMRAPATQLLALIARIPGELTRALSLIEQLVGAAAGQGRPLDRSQATTLVIGRYFADSARLLKAAAAYAAEQSDALGSECAASLRDAVTVLMAVEAGVALENGLGETAQVVDLRVRALRSSLARPVRLVAGTLQTSEIELGGDLEITGRGAIGCTLRVLGDVSIEREGSSLRGGALSVGGTARIAELGSHGEAATHVRLGPVARLVAGVVHPGVVIELASGELLRTTAVRHDIDVGAVAAAAA